MSFSRASMLHLKASSAKGVVTHVYGRVFIGSQYTLRLELDGAIDTDAEAHITYTRGNDTIEITYAASGEILAFDSKRMKEAYILSGSRKGLTCEMEIHSNRAVVAHGFLYLEWSHLGARQLGLED